MNKRNYSFSITFMLIIISIAISLTGCSNSLEPVSIVHEIKDLKVHFIDVGQADCILIELPTDEEILIDAGNRADASTIINYIEKLNINDIEYFVLTHPHEDHIGSAPDVLENFVVEKIYMPDTSADSQIYKETIKAIENENAQLIKAKVGEKIIDQNNLTFDVLAPSSMWYSETNEFSLVTKLVYKDTSFIFTGDAESVSELEMVEDGINLKSDLLKVGHHGGQTSTSQIFLDAVNPDYAVISVGKDNSYGHPHKKALDRLNALGAKIYRTDELGTIIAISDGFEISIKQSASLDIASTVINNKDVTLAENADTKIKYIGNNNSLKFHIAECSSVEGMKEHNKVYFNSRVEFINQGYDPCGRCKP